MGMQDYGPAQNPLNSPSHTAHHKAIADAIVVDGPLTDRFAPIEHYHEGSRGYLFTYSGTDTAVAPPAGGVALTNTGGQTRRLALSDTDANGVARNVSLLLPGDGIVITDDPADPPVTGFARYILTADPIPQAGYTVMDLLRIDTVGSQTPPPVGTRVRIVAQFATSQFDPSVKAYVDLPDRSLWGFGQADNGWLVPSGQNTLERSGRMVQFLIRVYNNLGTGQTSGQAYNPGTIPVGYRPQSGLLVRCYTVGGGSVNPLQEFTMSLAADGGVSVGKFANEAWPAADRWITGTGVYMVADGS
jgi:hypothetical protein